VNYFRGKARTSEGEEFESPTCSNHDCEGRGKGKKERPRLGGPIFSMGGEEIRHLEKRGHQGPLFPGKEGRGSLAVKWGGSCSINLE